MYDNAVV